MLAPQSDEEIRPIADALRHLDPNLDIRWNPRAVVEGYGSYDALGRARDPRYGGRWEVVRYETPTLAGDRTGDSGRPACVYRVCFDASDKKQDEGSYRPVGWWLVEFMQRWDSAQAHFAGEMARAWKEHDDAEARLEQIDDAAAQDALEEMAAVDCGDQRWIGKGADFRAMAAAAAARALSP